MREQLTVNLKPIKFRGSWLHFQDDEFVKEFCALSEQSFYKVAGFNVLTRRHPYIGYVNAYLYSPELINDFTESDAQELKCWLRHKKIGQAFIYSSRKYPFLKKPESRGGTLFLDLTQDEETLWKNLEARCRKAVRKAEKNEVLVDFDNGEKYLEEWHVIYSNLAHERKFSTYSSALLLGLMNKGWGKLFIAKHREKLLGGVFFLFRGYCIGLAAGFGSGPAYRKYSPGNLLFWQAIKYAKMQGLPFFDFMGANDDPNHGPTQFKRSFGGEFVRIYKYTLDGWIMKKWLYNMVKKAGKISFSYRNFSSGGG